MKWSLTAMFVPSSRRQKADLLIMKSHNGTVLLTPEEIWNKAKCFHLKTKKWMMNGREYPGIVKQVCLV